MSFEIQAMQVGMSPAESREICIGRVNLRPRLGSGFAQWGCHPLSPCWLRAACRANLKLNARFRERDCLQLNSLRFRILEMGPGLVYGVWLQGMGMSPVEPLRS